MIISEKATTSFKAVSKKLPSGWKYELGPLVNSSKNVQYSCGWISGPELTVDDSLSAANRSVSATEATHRCRLFYECYEYTLSHEQRGMDFGTLEIK